MSFRLPAASFNLPDKVSKKPAFQKKIFKSLFWKFKWKFLLLFLLTFLISYLAFLIRFNLVNNLSYDRGRGHFFYLFGKYQLIEKINDNMVYVDWNKLLLILFLLYFPLKIILHLTLDYWQKNYEREVKVHLIKKLLNYADKNQELMIKKSEEKVYIINKIVPKFSRQFISIPVGFFEIFADIFFAVFSLYFLINSYHLFQLVPLLVIFILVNLIWFAFAYYFFNSSRQANLVKNDNYQNLEQSQIKSWLEGLQLKDKTKSSKNLSTWLENNSSQITKINFLSVLYQLPELIISGINILFLFLYYQVYCEGKGGLSWDIYFIANNLQTIFFKIKKGFNLLSAISTCQENYQRLKEFFN